MKIVGVDGVTDEEDYRGYQKMPAFANIPQPILEEGDEPAYIWRNHDEALIVEPKEDSQIIINYVIIIQMLYQ